MPRPMKRRTVCGLPEHSQFGPLGSCGGRGKRGLQGKENLIIMTVDEYETIRLIDLERMTQEECAAKMGVARTTVQAIYDEARKKLAAALVRGQTLTIEGGHYRLCEESGSGHCGPGCGRRGPRGGGQGGGRGVGRKEGD